MAIEHRIRVERLDEPQFKSCASCRHWWPERSADGQRRFLACMRHGAMLSARMPRPEDVAGVLALRVCVAYERDPAIVGNVDDTNTEIHVE
jgi:hypothetical protein